MVYTEKERNELLRTARESIQRLLEGGSAEAPSVKSRALQEPRGAFVTLRMGGELRGCIGYIEPNLPLAQTVQEVAQKAAFEDPRFSPLSSEELSVVEIEISVLSLVERVTDIQEIEIGTHGLVIESGALRGLLLPHVATNYRWDREQFLRQTAIKAGLPPEAWRKQDVAIYKFSTETFTDHVHTGHSP
ncbi:MAG TPA: AmmeMemoRadiSam system protein A [Bacteroidota bacterium]